MKGRHGLNRPFTFPTSVHTGQKRLVMRVWVREVHPRSVGAMPSLGTFQLPEMRLYCRVQLRCNAVYLEHCFYLFPVKLVIDFSYFSLAEKYAPHQMTA